MFEKLLVPTDLSLSGERILDYVGGLKDAGAKDVLLAHVSMGEGQQDFVLTEREERASDRMNRESQIMRRAGLKVKSLFLRGEPPQELLRVAAEEHVGLIVSGSHGKSPLDEMILGSTSETLGRRSSKAPVLLVRYGILEEKTKDAARAVGRNAFKRLLLPTDFSDCSEKALNFIVNNLKETGVDQVIVTHVVDDRHLLTMSKRDALKKERRENLEKIAARIRGKVKVETHLLSGSPVAEILRLAGETDVNTIVVGSHGKGLVREAFVGSVSQNVIRMANKPVLVIPHEYVV
ncbi:MAG: universal stress protein [Terriglobia bacterium]